MNWKLFNYGYIFINIVLDDQIWHYCFLSWDTAFMHIFISWMLLWVWLYFLGRDIAVFFLLIFKVFQVKEMVKELDTLLQCIEGPGGFRDACTIFQKGSVMELEQGIDTLSEKCRMWQVIFIIFLLSGSSLLIFCVKFQTHFSLFWGF